MTTEQRFWAKVDRRGADECWPWLARRDEKGYARFRFGGKTNRAHRYAYELLVGEIPAGLTIDHLCRNTGCVNPAHLEVVTIAENNRRAAQARGNRCRRGHLFTAETEIRKSGGARQCRICVRAKSRVSQAARRARRRAELQGAAA